MQSTTTEQFLDAIWSDENSEHPVDGFIALAKEVGGKLAHSWYTVEARDQLAARAAKLSVENPTWISCCCFAQKRRQQNRAAFVPGIWLDIDLAGIHKSNNGAPSKQDLPTREEAEAALAAMPVPPSFVVETGGGLCPWWLFDQPAEASPELAQALKRWEQILRDKLNGKHLDSVAEFSRILRVPGLTNNKYQNLIELPAELQNGKPPRRYTVAELVELLDADSEPAPAAPEPSSEPTTESPTNPPDVSRQDVLDALRRLGEHRRSAGSYDDWIKIGMALHSFDDSEAMLAEWWSWSNQSADFADIEPENLVEHWQSFTAESDGGVTFRTLFKMANEDDPPRTFRLKPTTGQVEDTVSLKYVFGTGKNIILKAVRGEHVLHLDELNPRKASQRTTFARALAKKLDDPEFDSSDCEAQLLAIVEELDTPPVFDFAPSAPEPSLLERTAPEIVQSAQDFLEEPDLDCAIVDIQKELGIFGEDSLAKFVFLAAISRHFDEPINLVVLGTSSSGKSYVTQQVGKCFPPESTFVFTSASPKALLYTEKNLEHALLIFGERTKAPVEEQGEATGMLRQLLSDHKITHEVTESVDGQFGTREVTKHGPVSYIETTTSLPEEIFVEDFNRMLAISPDESVAQTRRVVAGTARRHMDCERTDAAVEQFLLLHHTIHRIIEDEVQTIADSVGSRNIVVIPFAHEIAESLPDTNIEIRRTANSIYSLVKCFALLNFKRRDRNDHGALIATVEDYDNTRALLDVVLSRMMGVPTAAPEELELFEALVTKFGENSRFTTRQAEELSGLAKSTLRRRMKSLLAAGYLSTDERLRERVRASWALLNPEQREQKSFLPPLSGGAAAQNALEQQKR